MPSLNLRNVLRRNPDRLTLRDRAAALKIAAGLVIRPPKSGPEQTASAPDRADPHVSLLPSLRQAFAWTRDAAPIDNNGPAGSPDYDGATTVMRHCWGIADRILDLPAPKTPAGLGAVALALSVWTEGMIGKDLDRCREERRTASAIRAMMSVAGAEFLPEWTGFGDEPDSRARWEAMMERAGEGSLPAWALAGKSGPDDAEA